jgi:hypothetical protein
MPEPHTLFEITIRTIQERFLLTPSPKLNSIVLGVIGRAMSLYPDVRIYLFKFMSNHFHLDGSAPDPETLSAFMGHINGNIAKEVSLLCGWNAKFWGRRYRPIAIRDRGALIRSVKYILSHGCKEGLVLEPQEWPGVGCERALLYGEKLEGIWYDRTAFHQAERRGKDIRLEDFAITYEVPLTPLPFLQDVSKEEAREFYRRLEAEIIEETREKLIQDKKQPLGAEAIISQDPFSRPGNPKKSPAPMCHASSRRTRKKFLRAYKFFAALYHQAVEKLRRGERNVEFPENCFLPPIAYRGPPMMGLAPG